MLVWPKYMYKKNPHSINCVKNFDLHVVAIKKSSYSRVCSLVKWNLKCYLLNIKVKAYVFSIVYMYNNYVKLHTFSPKNSVNYEVLLYTVHFRFYHNWELLSLL